MPTTIGIDLGMGSIKVVELRKEGEGVSLASIGEVANPVPNWLHDGPKSKSGEKLAGAVKMLLHDLKLKPDRAVAALPEDEVVSRLVKLPPLKDDEIADALKYEAETFVPYPLDEVSIDYEVVAKDETGRLAVLAIAAKNELITTYIKLFKELGIELAAIESPAISMRRVINYNISGVDTIMLVDMGEKYSDIVSIYKGEVYFTRTMSVGGESLTRAISVNLGLDMPSAEEYKKAYGMKGGELEGKIKESLLPVFSNMAEEIRRAMVSYKDEVSAPVNLLILSGGGAHLPGLAEELTKYLGVEVQVIQPLSKIGTNKIVMPINPTTEGCRYSLAIGLALRGVT